MGCKKSEEQGYAALSIVVPAIAFFGALVGLSACVKHRRRSDRHHRNCGCQCGEQHEHRNGHGCGCDNGGAPRHGHGPGRHRIDPMRILDKRFASGEIDEEDYQRRRQVIKENS
jgi:hypothetical protein